MWYRIIYWTSLWSYSPYKPSINIIRNDFNLDCFNSNLYYNLNSTRYIIYYYNHNKWPKNKYKYLYCRIYPASESTTLCFLGWN
jgi:hypothetical protein